MVRFWCLRVLSLCSNIFADAGINETSEPAYHDHTETNHSFVRDMERLAADLMQRGAVFPQREPADVGYATDNHDHVSLSPHSGKINFH